MSDAGTAVQNPPAAQPDAAEGQQNRVVELKVSGHLMTLDNGVFCVFQTPNAGQQFDRSGLPGVRISLPPNAAGRSEAVDISTFRDDGWIDAHDSAALIRVTGGPAQVLVTVYQVPNATPDMAPRLQVMRLGSAPEGVAQGRPAAPVAAGGAAQPEPIENPDIIAHVQRSGDIGARLGEWAGVRGSRLWIEGFGLAPHSEVAPADVEYQAVLGRGWLSPWIEGGKFCGSRGMALPLLGLKVRLRGAAAKTHECSYSATFVDGSAVGPVQGGETCEAESLAALEAFQVTLRPRGGSRARAAQPAPKAAPGPQRPTRKAPAAPRRTR